MPISLNLPEDLLVRLDEERRPKESRSAQVVRLLNIGLKQQEETMARPDCTLEIDCKVGIYEAEYVSRIYADKIVVTIPYVKWVNNSGSYAERKVSIRDQAVVDAVRQELTDDAETSAWRIIGREIEDDYLANQ